METTRKNRNRGYQTLIVWQDAIELYRLTSVVFRRLPYDLRRVVGQQLAACDSVHRNIAEGYCRRSLNEYLNFLNYALGSLGEYVSGLVAYRTADQITAAAAETLDALAYKLENGLLRLTESLQQKKLTERWSETNVVKETNAIYSSRRSQRPITPTLHHPVSYV